MHDLAALQFLIGISLALLGTPWFRERCRSRFLEEGRRRFSTKDLALASAYRITICCDIVKK